MPPTTRPPVPHRRDPIRLLALALCFAFAMVGTVPLLLGVLLKSPQVVDWASRVTAELLQEQLGLEASYRVEVGLVPLEVAVRDLTVASSDGGMPALRVERASLRPRLLALLAGRFEVEEIVVDQPQIRAVLWQGKLRNVAYHLPELKSGSKTASSDRPPFQTLAINDAQASLDIDGVTVDAGSLDVDVFAERGPSFEIAVRAAGWNVGRERTVMLKQAQKGNHGPIYLFPRANDEDLLCRMDLRARVEGRSVLVRRLTLLGYLDDQFAPGTRPSCSRIENEDDPSQVAVRLSQFKIGFDPGKRPTFSGHVVARAPASLVNRLVKAPPLRGWVGVSADVRFDERMKLPQAEGRIRGGGIQLERYRLAKELDVDFRLARDAIRVSRLEMTIADGRVTVRDLEIQPLAPGVPLRARDTLVERVEFTGLMRDLGVTPKTIVNWGITSARVADMGGTLAPVQLDGIIRADTRDFEIFNRGFADPARKHMLGVRSAAVDGRIGVRPNAFELSDIRATFGSSEVLAKLVSIGFSNTIRVEVAPSSIALEDISPITTIPWSGRATLGVTLSGPMGDPVLEGGLSIKDFVFAKFPIGDIESSKVVFRPLKVDFKDVRGRKGKTELLATTARLNFDHPGAILIDAQMNSNHFELRDLFHMFHFDQDPRFDDLSASGRVESRIHFDLGGPEDRCGGGSLRIQGRAEMDRANLYSELYDGGNLEFDMLWSDRDAGYRGVDLSVPSFTLHKGTGHLLGSVKLRPGAVVAGHVLGTSVPLASFQAFGSLGTLIDAQTDLVGEISGSIDQLQFDSHVSVGSVYIGTRKLPPSSLGVRLTPLPPRSKPVAFTRCGQPISPPFDPAEYERDEPDGVFHVNGSLFGGQVSLKEVQATRQRSRRVTGDIEFVDLDLGALAQLSPKVALAETKPDGRLTAKLKVKDLRTLDPARAEASLSLSSLSLRWNGMDTRVHPGAEPISIGGGELRVPGMVVSVKAPGGPEATLDLLGAIKDLSGSPSVDAHLQLRPVALSSLTGSSPSIERASGSLVGELHLEGPLTALRYGGGFHLRDGELALTGLPSPITEAQVSLLLDGSELRVESGSARMGDGKVDFTASASLHGFQIGATRAEISARSLSLPLTEGVKTTLDADLVATYAPASPEATVSALPRVTGTVTVQSFEYSRPITLSVDIASLAQRGRRTSFESYDPEADLLGFDITLRAQRALEIRNNLVETALELPSRGLQLAGTNQRFGVRGNVTVKPGGMIRLRRNEFEIKRGEVRFDDLTQVAPQVDVMASTEYRRYSTTAVATRQAEGGSSQSATSAGGRWVINMRAHGDADKLAVDLSSQPQLAQDDIFLLLTIGLTRTELEQARNASVGGSVALEALGTLTGADRAVQEVVPVIDEFRFGSAYSTRTGRTEPTVTIGKRLADRLRAQLTSGLSESREVRSTVEWQVGPRVSVAGTYDNINDISSSALGNLGGNVRWRLEFE